MPIQSKYSNQEFEALMQDVFIALEKNQADRDLSIMALGNVLATIFTNQVNEKNRAAMVDNFCKVLQKTTLSAATNKDA
ncbi:DUF1414 domain-containing protein [Glaciecola sp. XM2]|jgi:uncharacterized protein YejL (UPF0352 family)|uniref:DUF1414 domain-containing protein n=1 Tax=Glaciecola sp. XM2 TaxID=1914931 RepID=UPI001BDE8C7B|nr:DUF1414 domain-containing protein [Glaciecola sp. XM2]MBT1451966.1 DUF1414 domain-containing protein [Glaciecola sp. XM2]